MEKQLGKAYWGTPGRYLPRNMLMVFVEEIGHEYKALLEGAMDDAPPIMNEDSEILLSAAADQVKASTAKVVEEEDEEDDDEEDDDEEVLMYQAGSGATIKIEKKLQKLIPTKNIYTDLQELSSTNPAASVAASGAASVPQSAFGFLFLQFERLEERFPFAPCPNLRGDG